ncbi:hypothetical protein JAAARDRAFT_29676 [Jaapia argillacea MUCL 33604]|uniref:Cytochrome P450 n=1 Tax=Jaapia argillacea MUCL 33604 TaxID=933084 RepID=A0A067QJF0_9AGAM|nr:hypothetical protein JAAARDRAFT_29676 [Jaapia argillacea MUCL 33604]
MAWRDLLNPASPDFWFIAGCAAVVIVIRQTAVRKVRRLLPPGPKSSWFGQVELPKTYQWKTYAEWRKIYGDLIYIHVFGNPLLVINSAKVASDLLDKRSGNYSSRPVRTMVTELMGWDWLFSTHRYGQWWRKHRTLFHHHFHSNAGPDFQPIQTKETYTMLRNLAHDPTKFSYHIRRTAAAVVMFVSYGHQIAQEGDEYVTLADKALACLGQAGIFGTYLVDYIPMLKYVPSWVPGAGFQNQAKEWRKLTQAMINRPFEKVKEKMANGTAIPCVAATELEKWIQSSGSPEDERVIKDVSAIAYAAGADTTVSAIQSFFLAMSTHPEIQRKAQEEIDRVIGTDRLPLFSDKESLPYVDSIVWECLRWNPVTPLGISHAVTADDEYDGYYIPRGTTVLPNVWGMLHDEETYPDPLSFSPERYMDREKNAATGVNELPWIAFGFGRRMCPGRWFALDQVWLAAATVLSVFHISKALDDQGRPIEPDLNYTSGLLSRPNPFQCEIVPRSEKAVLLLKNLGVEQL